MKTGNTLENIRMKGTVSYFHHNEQLGDSCMIAYKHFSFVIALA